MPLTRRPCPTCHRSLRITRELPARVKCPRCGTGFTAAADLHPASAAPSAHAENRAGWAFVWLLGGGGFLVLAVLILLAICFTARDTDPKPDDPPPDTSPGAVVARQKGAAPAVSRGEGTEQKSGPPDAGIKKDDDPPDETPRLKIRVLEIATKERRTGPKRLRLAVTPPQYDNMGMMLNSLGTGYKWTPITDVDLRSSNRLADFDVVFLTCAGSRPNDKELGQSLRAFVESGGTLYASDLRFTALKDAFPDFLAKKITPPGKSQDLTAHVVEGGLREALGEDQIQLNFNKGNWRPACFDRAQVTIFIEGWYQTTRAEKAFAPLLVRFACGKGTVIFTSFHNAAQNSETEQKLLRYLVFTAVTSAIERKVHMTMISGDFSAGASRRMATSAEQAEVTHTYHNKKAGPLRFALGFADQGAKLRLTLVAPDGRKIAKEGTATFTVEVANAPAGEWRYTVTALAVPFPNFPFTLTVGEASKQ